MTKFSVQMKPKIELKKIPTDVEINLGISIQLSLFVSLALKVFDKEMVRS